MVIGTEVEEQFRLVSGGACVGLGNTPKLVVPPIGLDRLHLIPGKIQRLPNTTATLDKGSCSACCIVREPRHNAYKFLQNTKRYPGEEDMHKNAGNDWEVRNGKEGLRRMFNVSFAERKTGRVHGTGGVRDKEGQQRRTLNRFPLWLFAICVTVGNRQMPAIILGPP